MQYQERTRFSAANALVVVLAAAAITLAVVGLFGRTISPTAQVTDGTSDTRGEVTDGWMHNDILIPRADNGLEVTDGWMHSDLLTPGTAPGEVTDGWIHNDVLIPPADGETVTRDGPPGR